MSTKKNKFNHKDRFFMNLAINLASERSGLTGENNRPYFWFACKIPGKKLMAGSGLC